MVRVRDRVRVRVRVMRVSPVKRAAAVCHSGQLPL
jgi:hypothetical protein